MSYSILFSEKQIAERLKALVIEIESTLPKGEDIIVLALLNGCLWFAADLLRILPEQFILKTLKTASYGSEKHSSGVVTLSGELNDFSGKTVLVLDDVVDTALTLELVCRKIRESGAKEVFSCVAVNKHGQRQIEFEPDFAAFTAGQEFLIGYGMDHDEKYRNLPFIAVLED